VVIHGHPETVMAVDSHGTFLSHFAQAMTFKNTFLILAETAGDKFLFITMKPPEI